jgi:hypothetical protein
MNTRKYRQHLVSQSIARFRLMGWVMLMMFALVKAASAVGATNHGGVSNPCASRQCQSNHD